MSAPRIMIADDHALLLDAFRSLLEPTYKVVGAVQDGRALLEVASQLLPDVILLDIAMPLLSGIEAARQLKKQMPFVKLIFLTMNEDPNIAVEAMRIGASGFLLKTAATKELFGAIEAALRRDTYVTPQVKRAIMDALIDDPERKNMDKILTSRQREVLQLLAEGKSMKEAGAVLNVTARTIAFHKYCMMKTLGIKTSAGLVQYAVKNHILVS